MWVKIRCIFILYISIPLGSKGDDFILHIYNVEKKEGKM